MLTSYHLHNRTEMNTAAHCPAHNNTSCIKIVVNERVDPLQALVSVIARHALSEFVNFVNLTNIRNWKSDW